jgi:hypothetical protein
VLSLSLVLAVASSAAAATFTATSSTVVLPANSSPQAVAIGDLNGDGSLDLATANSGTRRVSSLVNNGSGMFTTSLKSGSTGQFPDALAIGDLNHDGLADVATANGSGNSVTLYLGTSTGTSITDPSLNFPDAVAIGDLNNDGFNDIAVANEDASTVTLFTQVPASPGTFTTSTVAVGDAPSSIAIGDLNGDGLPDLVVANESDNTVSVFLQNAGGGLNSTATVTLPTGDATAPISVAIGDLNGDSRADLAVANNNNNTATVFLQNANGPFGFTAQTPLATGGGPYSIVIGDLNGDGQPDLAVANNSNTFTTGPTNTVTVFLQNADGSYSPTTVPVGSGPQRVVIGDLAGKGRLDLATSNMFSNNVTLLANTTPQSTSASLAASPTTSTVGQSVAFTTTVAPDVQGLRGQASPTGTVTYTIDGAAQAPVAVSGAGTAALMTASLSAGPHSITATYSGDANYAPSTTASTTYTVTAVTLVAPVVVTGGATGATSSGATLSGSVNPSGSSTDYVFEYGSTAGPSGPTFGAITPVSSAGVGSTAVPVTATAVGLTSNTTYYYRLVATNAGGTSIGAVMSFNTTGVAAAPAVTTAAATSITTSSAALAGTVNPEGQITAFTFEYGSGVTGGSPTFGAITPVDQTDGTFISNSVGATLSGLTPSTTYYYRLVATNAAGTTVGPVMSFNTGGTPSAPAVVTSSAKAVTASSATFAGTVNPEGQATSFTFEYGSGIAAGSPTFGSITPVDETDHAFTAETVGATVTGLTPNTTYYYRLIAANATGTTTGSIQSFTTPGS